MQTPDHYNFQFGEVDLVKCITYSKTKILLKKTTNLFRKYVEKTWKYGDDKIEFPKIVSVFGFILYLYCLGQTFLF